MAPSTSEVRQWMPTQTRASMTSSSASSKRSNVRCVCSDHGYLLVTVNVVSRSWKKRLSTPTAAALEVVWPDVYSGKFGVLMSGFQFGSASRLGMPPPREMAVTGRQKLKVSLQCQHAIWASAAARLVSAKHPRALGGAAQIARREIALRALPQQRAAVRPEKPDGRLLCGSHGAVERAKILRFVVVLLPLAAVERRRTRGHELVVALEREELHVGHPRRQHGQQSRRRLAGVVRRHRSPLAGRGVADISGRIGREPAIVASQRDDARGCLRSHVDAWIRRRETMGRKIRGIRVVERYLLRREQEDQDVVRRLRSSGVQRAVRSGDDDMIGPVLPVDRFDRVVDRGMEDREVKRRHRRWMLRHYDDRLLGDLVPVHD